MRHRRLADIAGLSHVGRRRKNNEDAIAWDAELGLALVADGIGGSNAGEVASVTAVRGVKSDLRLALQAGASAAVSAADHAALVRELVHRAHQRVLATAAREPQLRGMATTLALALLAGDVVTVANVGDSRVYRMRGATFERLTRDHLLVADLVERGSLTEEESQTSRHRNVLTRALGMEGKLDVDVAHYPVEPGDLYLLCSDGLTRDIGDDELSALLQEKGAILRDAAHEAVALANRRGGGDNVSVILMRLA